MPLFIYLAPNKKVPLELRHKPLICPTEIYKRIQTQQTHTIHGQLDINPETTPAPPKNIRKICTKTYALIVNI